MADDITAAFIRKIKEQLTTADATFLQDRVDLLDKITNVVGIAANYAQLLSLLVTSTATEGYGGLAIVLASLVMGIGTVSKSKSGDKQVLEVLEELYQDIAEVKNIVGVDNWRGKMDEISPWIIPVYTTLDTIYHEGLHAPNVTGQAPRFADYAKNLLIFLLRTPSVWIRPFVPSKTFSLPYPAIYNWYGNLPKPPAASVDGYPTVFDPQYTLPAWLFTIESWLAIYALLHEIDPKQPKFNEFLIEYQDDLVSWADFLKSRYEEAVKGLVKSDFPSDADIIGLLNYNTLTGDPPENLTSGRFSGGSRYDNLANSANLPNTPVPTGWAWNEIIGVVDIYAVFHQPAFHRPAPAGDMGWYGFSYIVEIFWPWLARHELGNSTDDAIRSLTCPWVRARVALRLMAQWKAIYLIHGYDKAWSVLQRLRILANQLPDDEPTLPDGTKANGNWSVRELYTSLDQILQNSSPIWPGPGPTPGIIHIIPDQISLDSLMLAMDMLARGNWSGPARGEAGLSKPVSFRDRLGAATGVMRY